MQGDKAALTAHMPSGQNLVFTLSRHGQSWLIQRIENVTAEEDGLLFQETEPEEKFILSLNDTLYTGDTLTIRFKAPHPKDLAITGPGDTFYFLVYQAFGQDMPPLVEPEKFGDLNKLDIITDQTKANPWVAGNKENRLIFTKAGKYTIRLSENLETDDGTPVETKEVYYTAKPRRN